MRINEIEYEKLVVEQMISLYCRKKHKSQSVLCSDCEMIRIYASDRLTNCPFGEDKPACKECKIHCYSKSMREEIRKIMKFSGPRMIFYFPKEFITHQIKKRL